MSGRQLGIAGQACLDNVVQESLHIGEVIRNVVHVILQVLANLVSKTRFRRKK